MYVVMSDAEHAGQAGPAAERFERLYREHFRAILRYTLARTDPETARDVTADTFLVAWRRLDDVPSRPEPWLYGVARRRLADQRRAAGRRDALSTRLESAAADSAPAAIEDSAIDRATMLAALASLRDSDREALLLVAWDGLTSTAAAAAVGVSRITFGVRLHRARKRLAAAIEASDMRPIGARHELHTTAREVT